MENDFANSYCLPEVLGKWLGTPCDEVRPKAVHRKWHFEALVEILKRSLANQHEWVAIGEADNSLTGGIVGVDRTPGGLRHNHEAAAPAEEGFVDVGAAAEIPENRARIVCLSGERVAVFKYEGKVSAVSNVCQHQNGPLGEGKIVFGCITCPWHGYQYLPETGASPPPFVEKIPTFNVRVKNGRVWVDPRPNPAGTRAEPARLET